MSIRVVVVNPKVAKRGARRALSESIRIHQTAFNIKATVEIYVIVVHISYCHFEYGKVAR
jgi:hypothetical protein